MTEVRLGSSSVDSDSRDLVNRIRATLEGRRRLEFEDPALTCAAVLVPLVFKDGEWHVLVTQRTQTVDHHKGQIAFPGGACDPDDADGVETALRETFEEIGVPPTAIEVLGALDDFATITAFVITPFVGIITEPVEYSPSACEVETVLEVPVSFFLDPTHLRVEQWEERGRVREILFWDYGEHTIWGASARILKNLLDSVF
jgi:8-oxo-dGTP pyrophosphatase MutT (NUDIX family)